MQATKEWIRYERSIPGMEGVTKSEFRVPDVLHRLGALLQGSDSSNENRVSRRNLRLSPMLPKPGFSQSRRV